MITNEKDILCFKEVIELLGISRSTLYKLTSNNKIPCFRPTNGKLFFKRELILNWLANSGNSQKEQSVTSNLNTDK